MKESVMRQITYEKAVYELKRLEKMTRRGDAEGTIEDSLLWGARVGQKHFVRACLDLGADSTVDDNKAERTAILTGHNEIARMLEEHTKSITGPQPPALS